MFLTMFMLLFIILTVCSYNLPCVGHLHLDQCTYDSVYIWETFPSMVWVIVKEA